jgi:hypothetical protein
MPLFGRGYRSSLGCNQCALTDADLVHPCNREQDHTCDACAFVTVVFDIYCVRISLYVGNEQTSDTQVELITASRRNQSPP